MPVDGYEWALPADDEDLETFLALDGRPQRAWRSPVMKLLKVDDDGRPLQAAGLPWLGSHVLVLRDRAVDSIGPLLEPHGNLLPLECAEVRLVVFDAHVLTGVLDEERSEVVRFSTGRIMRLTRPVFGPGTMAHGGAFKVAQMPRGPIFFSADLVRAIQDTGDSAGTDFVPIGRRQG